MPNVLLESSLRGEWAWDASPVRRRRRRDRRAHWWARAGKSGGPRRLGTPLPNLPKMAPGRVSPAAPVVGSGGLDAGLGWAQLEPTSGLGWARLEPTGGLGSSPAPFHPLTLIGLAGL